MLYPLQFIIDNIFPPTKHGKLLKVVSLERFIHWYHPVAVKGVICLSEYKLAEVQAAIAACKFEHNYHAAILLSVLAKTYLTSLPPLPTLLIPVPLSRKRQHKRQFNQVERVLESIKPFPSQYKISTNLMLRTSNTKPQTSLTRTERLTNLSGAFAVHKPNLFYLDNIKRIIICDDVMTTGATIQEVKKVLMPYVSKDVEIVCLAWAH